MRAIRLYRAWYRQIPFMSKLIMSIGHNSLKYNIVMGFRDIHGLKKGGNKIRQNREGYSKEYMALIKERGNI